MPKGIVQNPKKATRKQLQVWGGGKRAALSIEKDTWYAVGELVKGKTYAEIAEDLNKKNGYNLNPSTIWRDIERALVEWKRQNMENIDAYIAKELARIEHIEGIVMQNFEKSKTPRPNEYAALMKRGMTPDEIDEMYAERGGMAGDPHYIEVLLHLQKQRMDLLGLSKGNDVGQTTIINYGFNNVDLGDLTKIADALQDGKRKEILIDEQ